MSAERFTSDSSCVSTAPNAEPTSVVRELHAAPRQRLPEVTRRYTPCSAAAAAAGEQPLGMSASGQAESRAPLRSTRAAADDLVQTLHVVWTSKPGRVLHRDRPGRRRASPRPVGRRPSPRGPRSHSPPASTGRRRPRRARRRARAPRRDEADRLRHAIAQRAVADDHARQAVGRLDELENALLLAQPAGVEDVGGSPAGPHAPGC